MLMRNDIAASRSLKCSKILLGCSDVVVDAKNNAGETALKIAIGGEKYEIAVELIKSGADTAFLLGE